eukprot:TRINITY_DN886_c0_g1_i1.p1 TRINITY_DN886_c0_g1~~TRINITY_DN886_c0_g1_i1.p1  ORF type:complete len:121 (+),score=5.67 TRINITY_DN886_c0_g1_i1:92-454(+)
MMNMHKPKTMRFCKTCNNLLIPQTQEGEDSYMWKCRNIQCGMEEVPDSGECIVYSRGSKGQSGVRHSYDHITSDPTFQRKKEPCSCGNREVVLFQSRSDDTSAPMKCTYVCTVCKKSWEG